MENNEFVMVVQNYMVAEMWYNRNIVQIKRGINNRWRVWPRQTNDSLIHANSAIALVSALGIAVSKSVFTPMSIVLIMRYPRIDCFTH